ncbi:hypothetical protein K438DRAFT_1761681 [Mycena galopus ATCC 62051]|nr:hypothetical protein K438DRAFT_1761681 [Mycena galopus ATCC 62051]
MNVFPTFLLCCPSSNFAPGQVSQREFIRVSGGSRDDEKSTEIREGKNRPHSRLEEQEPNMKATVSVATYRYKSPSDSEEPSPSSRRSNSRSIKSDGRSVEDKSTVSSEAEEGQDDDSSGQADSDGSKADCGKLGFGSQDSSSSE